MGPYTRFFWLISSLDFVLSSVIYESKLLPQSLVRLELNQNKLRLSFFLVIFFAYPLSVIYESKLLTSSVVRLELNQNKLRLSFFLVIFFAGLPILCQSFTKVNS